MKIYILETQDSNGCRLLTFFDRDSAMSAASQWLTSRMRFGDPDYVANLEDNMYRLSEGEELTFADDATLRINDSDLDMSGIVDVLEDTLHTLGKYKKFVAPYAGGTTGRLKRYGIETEAALNETLLKLKGQS